MRKTFGLCFLALSLTAGTAQAQGLFLENGQPGISIANSEAVIGTGWSASLIGSYTYRGIFDLGLDVTRYSYGSGDEKGLSSIGLMPFANVYFLRAEDGQFPISVSGTLAIQKRIYMGNNEAPNPDGWGLLVGGSLFRRIEFSNSFAGIPELFLAYDLQSITWHSSVINPISTAAISPGETTNYDHRARVLFRANMGFKAGPVVLITVSPYVGYQFGLAVGANVGAIF
jgi:hypothetical protein